jgi:capsular polysaccharide biosynthesis protein
MSPNIIRLVKERASWLRPLAAWLLRGKRHLTGGVANILRRAPFLRQALRLPSSHIFGWEDWLLRNPKNGFEVPLDPGRELNIPLPEGRSLDMAWLFEKESKCLLQRSFVAGIRNGLVWNHHGGCFFSEKRELIWDLGREHWLDICQLRRPAAMSRLSLPRSRQIKGSVAVLASPDASSNYGHWLLDVAPKLGLLERAGWGPDRIDHYLVGHTDKQFQWATLDAVGVPREKVLRMDECPMVQADLILQPFLNSYHFTTFQPSTIQYLRKVFLGGDAPTKPDGPERIFITREDATFRKVTNMGELREVFEPLGFVFVSLDGMSVPEQARLINGAGVIVSPNGSGLMNMVFARKGAFVLEFAHARYTTMFHWKICHAAGVRYAHIASDDEPVTPNSEQRLLYADVKISPVRLLEVLKDADVL